jgi:hypothetical protein
MLLLVKNQHKKTVLLKTTLNSKEKNFLWKSPNPEPEIHPPKPPIPKDLKEKIPEILNLEVKKPDNLDNLDNKNLENLELMLPEKILIPYSLEI